MYVKNMLAPLVGKSSVGPKISIYISLKGW